jgi:hypothetical protein
MRLQRISDDACKRFEADGTAERGQLMIDEAGMVRWCSDVELAGLVGVGEPTVTHGHLVYTDEADCLDDVERVALELRQWAGGHRAGCGTDREYLLNAASRLERMIAP